MDERIMDRLVTVKGYLGGAISSYTGECIACHSISDDKDFENILDSFTDIFADAHKISHKLKLGLTDIIEIYVGEVIVLMVCLGEESRIHIHIFALFHNNGNIELGKIELDKIIHEAVNLLDEK